MIMKNMFENNNYYLNLVFNKKKWEFFFLTITGFDNIFLWIYNLYNKNYN